MRTIKTNLLSKLPYLAFSLLLIMACNPKETKTEAEPEPTKEPGQIISEEEAAVLFDTYSTNRVPCIEENENSDMEEGDEKHITARYTFFDFKVMQEYMKFIEEQAYAAGKDIKTLRIYYATYPDDSPKDPNKNTVFLVPTTDFGDVNKAFKIVMKDGKHVAEEIPWDFNRRGEEQEGDAKSQAGFLPMLTANAMLDHGGSLILNDGGTSPPPPNQ